MPTAKRIGLVFLFLAALCCGLTIQLKAEPLGLAGYEDDNSNDAGLDSLIHPVDLMLGSVLTMRHTRMDCTHLVHYVYEESGLAYTYANSKTLYRDGARGFRRVFQPQPGDLIVWRGHAGIVVDPESHSFVSALRTGVKVSSYISAYWRRRGTPRFLRYVGEDDADD